MKTLEIIEKKWSQDFDLKIGFIDDQLIYIGFPDDPLPKFFANTEIIAKKEDFSVNQKLILQLIDAFINKKNLTFKLSDFYQIGTKFERQVWTELQNIPLNSTITYSDLAIKMGKPKSTRAVATAVAKNPFLLLIPCHRVVSKDGTLKYRGGAEKKRFLLTKGY